MPWSTVPNHPDCPSDRPWAVIADDSGEVEGCHAIEDDANAQVAALYANEEDLTGDPVLAAVYDVFDGDPDDAGLYTKGYWEGPLAVETVETGDAPRREFDDGALVWRDPPLCLEQGHDSEVGLASIDRVWRGSLTLKDGSTVPAVFGRGRFDMEDDNARLHFGKVRKGVMRGVSIKLDDVEEKDVEYVFPEGEEPGDDDDDALMDLFAMPEKVIFHHARIMNTALTTGPALQEASIRAVPDAEGDAWESTDDERPELPDEEPVEGEPVVLTAKPLIGPFAALDHTSVVVVLRPTDDGFAVPDGLPDDELHVTLGFYGDADGAPVDDLKGWLERVEADFEAKVSGVARMGDDDPQAVTLLLEANELAELRASLEEVAEPDRTHPHFTPHMTLGYGVPLPDETPASLGLGSPELWVGPDRFGPEGALTAALSIPVAPPTAWFLDPKFDGPTAPTYFDSGRCFGHLAEWGACHIGFGNVCRQPPRAPKGDYRYYRTGEIVTAEGDHIAVGQLTVGPSHAPLHLGVTPAAAHYEDTGRAVADVSCGEDRWGIWYAGALRPEVDERMLRMLRASKLSGDWRGIRGRSRLIAGMVVNVPGYPIPRTRAYEHNGKQVSLVAAGMVGRDDDRHEERAAMARVADRIARSIGRDYRSLAASAHARVHARR